MALHFFKSAGGVSGIADDAGGTGAAIFDDVTFNGTTGQSREQGLFVRNAVINKTYESIVITFSDSDPVLDPTNFRLALTSSGLNTATPGASLALPNLGAGPSETAMFIRCTINAGTAVANYTGIKVIINAIELAV